MWIRLYGNSTQADASRCRIFNAFPRNAQSGWRRLGRALLPRFARCSPPSRSGYLKWLSMKLLCHEPRFCGHPDLRLAQRHCGHSSRSRMVPEIVSTSDSLHLKHDRLPTFAGHAVMSLIPDRRGSSGQSSFFERSCGESALEPVSPQTPLARRGTTSHDRAPSARSSPERRLDVLQDVPSRVPKQVP